jgi:hypothetical protein
MNRAQKTRPERAGSIVTRHRWRPPPWRPECCTRGVEANCEQHFTFLSGPLRGFGAGGNIAYVDSRFMIRPGEHATLPSSSRTTWNAALFYEKYGLTQ